MNSSVQSESQVTKKLHIAIVGAGAVGLTLATYLSAAGHRVTLVTRPGKAPAVPLSIDDQGSGHQWVLNEINSCRLERLPPELDFLVVATRGEQLEPTLASLCDRLEPHVPVVIAAASLHALPLLARKLGLRNPILRMAVGFGTWPTEPGHYRLFSLREGGGSLVSTEVGVADFARTWALELTRAGLPTQAVANWLFRRMYHTVLALETGHLLAYRKAGWELDVLGARTDLIRSCAETQREVATIVRETGGVFAWVASLLPLFLLRRVAVRRVRLEGPAYRDIWRHHGPKTTDQLDFITRQLLSLAGEEKPPPALLSWSEALGED